MLKKILEYKLKVLAKLILDRYKPDVIGITGSVGKTSAKEAIYTVLSAKFRVRQNNKNYNNEIGLPLSILGFSSPGGSILGWLWLFLRGVGLLVWKDKNFPEILILEMGVDRPGDMEYLVNIARPRIGVVTTVGQSHLEYFETVDRIEKEKSMLIRGLAPNGWAILNYDDERVRRMEKVSKSRVISFGFSEKADLRAMELVFSFEKDKKVNHLAGLSFKMSYDGSVVPAHLPQVVGYAAVYSALTAAATGLAFGMNMIEISQALFNYQAPHARMSIVPGVKNSLIIDDTYNASPQSTVAALEVTGKIKLIKPAKRWAVLGDMLELGNYTEEGHRLVGQKVVENGFDYLVAVGERASHIIDSAKEAGMNEDVIYHFSKSEEAKLFIQERMKEGDLLLVKGSQGMRMERIVKEIMAEPERAAEMLVRQDWPDA